MTDEDLLTKLKLIRSGLRLELERIEEAIKDLEENGPQINETEIEEVLPEREEYDNNMSFEHKINWVLASLGAASAPEITDEIMMLEDKQTGRSMLLEIITHTALKMFSVQKINAIRRSGIIIYSLKEY